MEAEVDHKVETWRGFGCGNAVDGNPTDVGSNDAQPLTLNVRESWRMNHENRLFCESLVPISHELVNLKWNSPFSSCSY